MSQRKKEMEKRKRTLKMDRRMKTLLNSSTGLSRRKERAWRRKR